jgi:hypothetical protein
MNSKHKNNMKFSPNEDFPSLKVNNHNISLQNIKKGNKTFSNPLVHNSLRNSATSSFMNLTKNQLQTFDALEEEKEWRRRSQMNTLRNIMSFRNRPEVAQLKSKAEFVNSGNIDLQITQ